MRKYISVIIVSLIAGVVGGAVSGTYLHPYFRSTESLIRDFYETETAVHVSPHGLRKKIMEGKRDFILVDLRSPQEYEKEHVVGAINIPAYKDPDTPVYDDVDRIVSSFRSLPQNKTVIVYCYSTPCMTGRKIGHILAKHGIFVQHLGVGWNEWRYHWKLWNHEGEWDTTNVEDYIVSGLEAGSFTGVPAITPCSEGEFGC